MSHRLTLIVVAALALAAALFSSATRHSTTFEEETLVSSSKQPESPSAPKSRSEKLAVPPSGESSPSFAALAQKALDSLPRVETVRGSGSHFHHTPKALLDSSEALTQVSEALREHPEYVAQGIEFYRACANDSSLMTAVRAVCLQRLAHWTKDAELDRNAHPPELWDLAQGLPPISPR